MKTLCGTVLILVAVFYDRLDLGVGAVALLVAAGVGLLWEDHR